MTPGSLPFPIQNSKLCLKHPKHLQGAGQLEGGKVRSLTKWKQLSAHLPGYQVRSTSCSLPQHLPLPDTSHFLTSWASDSMLSTCPPLQKYGFPESSARIHPISPLPAIPLSPISPLGRRREKEKSQDIYLEPRTSGTDRFILERRSNPDIPACHPVPWISRASPSPCNSYQKSLPPPQPTLTTQKLPHSSLVFLS